MWARLKKLLSTGVSGYSTGKELLMYLSGERVSVASASEVVLANVKSGIAYITGTQPITSFGAADSGYRKVVTFAAALTLTHGSALLLPGSANITTAANDCAEFYYTGSAWLCLWYKKANGSPVSMTTIQSLIDSSIASLINSAPSALDTLNELASALGNDANFATTVNTALGNRITKPTSPTSGQVLTWNGTAWVAANATSGNPTLYLRRRGLSNNSSQVGMSSSPSVTHDNGGTITPLSGVNYKVDAYFRITCAQDSAYESMEVGLYNPDNTAFPNVWAEVQGICVKQDMSASVFVNTLNTSQKFLVSTNGGSNWQCIIRVTGTLTGGGEALHLGYRRDGGSGEQTLNAAYITLTPES